MHKNIFNGLVCFLSFSLISLSVQASTDQKFEADMLITIEDIEYLFEINPEKDVRHTLFDEDLFAKKTGVYHRM